jgi:hypothetical protein
MATPIADDFAAIAARLRELAEQDHLKAAAARLLEASQEAEMQRADEPVDG